MIQPHENAGWWVQNSLVYVAHASLIGLTIKTSSDRVMQAKTFLTPFHSLLHTFLQVMSSRIQPGIIPCQAGMPCLTISDKVSLPYQFVRKTRYHGCNSAHAPGGFSLLAKNPQEARYRGMPRNMASPPVYFWFYQQVRNKGPWDDKTARGKLPKFW